MKEQLLFNDLQSIRSHTIRSQKQPLPLQIRRISQSLVPKLRTNLQSKKQNLSTDGIHGHPKQQIQTMKNSRGHLQYDPPFIFSLQRQSTQRKPIFTSQKIQSSNIKFILPELHEYTPEAKSKIELRSLMSVKESLDLSFNNEEFVNSNNIQQKDDTVLSLPQMLQSALQGGGSRAVTEVGERVEEERGQKGSLNVLGLIGVLVAYCFYVILK